MSLTIQMRMFNNVKPLDVIYWKFVVIYFTSLTMLGLESKGSISYTIKEKLLLYCRNGAHSMSNIKYPCPGVSVCNWHF